MWNSTLERLFLVRTSCICNIDVTYCLCERKEVILGNGIPSVQWDIDIHCFAKHYCNSYEGCCWDIFAVLWQNILVTKVKLQLPTRLWPSNLIERKYFFHLFLHLRWVGRQMFGIQNDTLWCLIFIFRCKNTQFLKWPYFPQ